MERLGRLFTALAGGVVDTLEVSYEGQIADYDCKVLTLAALKGVLGPVVDEPVSFVNAPAIAQERGLVVRETKVGSARDYVNLVELRGSYQGRATHVAGTLYGKQDTPRIVGIDDHIIDVPPSAHMVVVRNDDVPGVIGTVGSILGDAKVNIDDMVVGRTTLRRGRRSWCCRRRRPSVTTSSRRCAPPTASSTPAPSSSTDPSYAERCSRNRSRISTRRSTSLGSSSFSFALRRLCSFSAAWTITKSTNAMIRKFTSRVRKLP